ncbi:MAG TPA: nitrile hydratase [Acetobacteraceae bacterium]|jgi:hypothetical protein|nr:nitrile hydratase [Acetobacteraceae bacterium]
MEKDVPRAMHDLGGISKFMCEPVDIEPHALSDFDRRVDALLGLVRARGLSSVDEHRRSIEAIPEADYHRLSYYQKWIRALAATLIRRGVLTEAEIDAALREV